MLVAQTLKIFDGLDRARSLTGDIEPEEVVRLLGNGRDFLRFAPRFFDAELLRRFNSRFQSPEGSVLPKLFPDPTDRR